MLDKEQKISNVHNSDLNQAGRDINITNNGVSVADVLTIVSHVVADKMTIYQQQAETTTKQRLEDFKNSLVTELQKKAEDKLERFNQPSVQMATRNAALGYIQNGDADEKENFIDMLIERVGVEEHTTKQHLIDKAIQVLPTLSPECLNLLAFIAYTNLLKTCHVTEYRKWVECINPIVDTLNNVSSLDIDFLNQADCSFNTMGFQRNDFIEDQMKANDLLFRHLPTKDFVEKFFDKNGIKVVDSGYHMPQGKNTQWMVTFLEVFGLAHGYTLQVQMSNFGNLKEILVKKGYNDIAEDLQSYYNATRPFTRDEVEKYYIDINPKWKDAFELLKRDDVKSLRLKPVGAYIACRILSRLSKADVSIEIFYNN